MRPTTETLWSLVRKRPAIDPRDLAAALQEQAQQDPLDHRTRWLIHDSLDALEKYWGRETLSAWLAGCPLRARLESIQHESFERPGFPSLDKRLMDKTSPDDVREFLRGLGIQVHRQVTLNIGGSASLILQGYLARHTKDINPVDEVPEIREQIDWMPELELRHGLRIAHFASHYLPSGWEDRVHSIEAPGALRIFLVDVYDIFLSKLFSAREKDRDDLRELKPQLDKEVLVPRLKDSAKLAADPELRRHAEENWYILYGESFPP